MGTKPAKQIDFHRLADALADFRFAYLVTVGDDYRVHTVTVEPELHERVLTIGLIGDRTRTNVESHGGITLLWPPSDPDDYSLIVDGRAEVVETDGVVALQVSPTRALLHRNADGPGDAIHDCVVLTQP